MKSVTNEDVCKKDFEVFCDLWNYDKTIDENGFYSSSLTDRLFTSFCAGWRDSRKALVVELPVAFPVCDDKDSAEVAYVLDILEKLALAGVSYK